MLRIWGQKNEVRKWAQNGSKIVSSELLIYFSMKRRETSHTTTLGVNLSHFLSDNRKLGRKKK